jgi:pimeloyl-ACP methyl ester carboxylesterase
MGRENVDDTRLFFTDEAASREKTEKDREEVLATPPEDAAKRMESLLTPTDAAALTGELAEWLVASEQEALAPGIEGWWEDNCMVRPWGFDLSAIAVPVLLLHGRQDMFVPFSHGEWLAAHIPGVEARLLDNDGHLTLLQNRMPEVHAWLSVRL